MDFHNQLAEYIKSNDAKAANILVMRELGSIIVRNKKDFVALLNECDIPASENMSDSQLVELYVKNLVNQRLLLGTAFLVNMHNKTMGADGESEVSDEGVKSCYDALSSNFIGENDLSDEDYANAGGWAAAVKGATDLGGKLADNQRTKKYGAQDILTKKLDAKAQLTQSIIDQKRAQIEAQNKKIEQQKKIQKIALISGAVILGISLVAFAIYKIKKK